MTSYTYDTLKQAVIRFAQDFSGDFATSFDDGLAKAEEEIAKDLNVDQMQFRSTIALVAGTYLYNRPSGAFTIRHITYANGTTTVFMEMRRHEWLIDYNPAPGVTANRAAPKYWAPYEALNTTTQVVTSQIMVAKTPDASYTATAECEGRITGLSSSITSTWLSSNQGNLLFNATIRKMVRFDQDDEMAKMWDAEYAASIQRTALEIQRFRSDDTSVLRAS